MTLKNDLINSLDAQIAATETFLHSLKKMRLGLVGTQKKSSKRKDPIKKQKIKDLVKEIVSENIEVLEKPKTEKEVKVMYCPPGKAYGAFDSIKWSLGRVRTNNGTNKSTGVGRKSGNQVLSNYGKKEIYG